MKTSRLLAALALLALAPPAVAQSPVERVLLVGDSWAEFMWNNRTLRDVFADNGRPDLVEQGSATALGGTTAAQWSQPSFLQLISDELAARPTIDVVQLTIGGNDFLEGQSGGGWYAGMPAADFEALTGRILDDVTVVVDHILALDPALEVLISLYDYTNFVDGSALLGCVSRWNDLGQPTPRQVNEAGIALQAAIDLVTAERPRVTLVDHGGTMQFTFGFPDDGIAPGTLLPPGDLDRPSPIESMFFQLDCIHLASDGYYAIGQNLWRGYYDGRFNGPLFADGFESGDLARWAGGQP